VPDLGSRGQPPFEEDVVPFALRVREEAVEGDVCVRPVLEGAALEIGFDHVDEPGVRLDGFAPPLQQVAEAVGRVEHQRRGHRLDRGVSPVVFFDEVKYGGADVFRQADHFHGYYRIRFLVH